VNLLHQIKIKRVFLFGKIKQNLLQSCILPRKLFFAISRAKDRFEYCYKNLFSKKIKFFQQKFVFIKLNTNFALKIYILYEK